MFDPQSSAQSQRADLAAGKETAQSIVEAIGGALDAAARCNALRDCDLALVEQARRSDARRAKGASGSLEGITISVKDNIALDGSPTTGCSPALSGYSPPEGLAVARLRDAGALFAAKTNLHELAFGITGANAHTGPVHNPFDRERLAGGSSSGAAAAVALGACAIAVATDTGGSCRIPAALCGVVGFRPTTYRYPVDGYLRLSPSRDTLGLLARTVADIALADAVISPEFGASAATTRRMPRLGVVRASPVDTGVADIFERALGALQQGGCELVESDLSDAFEADEACGFAIALFETARSIERLAREACGMELAAFAETIASPDVRGLIAGQCGAEAIAPDFYAEAITVHLPRLRSAFFRALEPVDALVYPTTPLTAPRIDHGEAVRVGDADIPVFPAYSMMTRADSMAGVPAISLPCGLVDGLPAGLQLAGRAGQDRALLTLAGALEAMLPARPVPPGDPR